MRDASVLAASPARPGSAALMLLSLALHAGLLGMWMAWPKGGGGAPAAQRIEVSLLAAPSPETRLPAGAAPDERTPVDPAVAAGAADPGVSPVATSTDAAQAQPAAAAGEAGVLVAANRRGAQEGSGPAVANRRSAQEGSGPAAAIAPAVPPDAAGLPRGGVRATSSWLPQIAGAAPYLPASQLDSRPYPESPVIVPFPEGETLAKGQRIAAILLLYVGIDGRVDRVEFAQSGLSPPFERIAIDTFLQARMSPGIKDGRPVRARMKVEVEFAAP